MKDGTLPNRYTITHKDGKPVDPNKFYLVLEMAPTPDERELAGIEAFATACKRTGYTELAASIRSTLARADALLDTAERVARRELNWEIKKIVPQDEDEDGRWYYATDGCRVAAICVPDDGKFDGYVAEYLSYRVAKYGDHSDPTFGVFTSLEMAEGEAEGHSDGTEDIWAVYNITDIYPYVVALAHYGMLYSRDWGKQ